MAKRKPPKNGNELKVDPLLQAAIRRGTERLVFLGMAVLKDDFGFTPDQTVMWAEALAERVKQTPEYELGK